MSMIVGTWMISLAGRSSQSPRAQLYSLRGTLQKGEHERCTTNMFRSQLIAFQNPDRLESLRQAIRYLRPNSLETKG